MTKEIAKINAPELLVIEQSKADIIRKTFEPMAEMLSGFESLYNDLMGEAAENITQKVTEKAKRLRLDIGKVRIETGKLKDKQKEYIKLEDKAIMGVHNVLVWAVKEKEDKLKEIEKHFEIKEQKRLSVLQSERVKELSVYIDDAHERDLAKFAQDEFEALLSMKKKEKEDRIAAEKKAEENRIEREEAEAEERTRIEAENESLKKEAKEREKANQKRKAKEEAERKIREEKERNERLAYEAKLKSEREEKEKIKREEREKRERLEAKLKAKEEAERKIREEEFARLQAELNKGDSAKVKDLIADINLLKTKYSFKSSVNIKLYSDVVLLLDKVVNHIEKL